MKIVPSDIDYLKLIEKYKNSEWIIITYRKRTDEYCLHKCKNKKTLVSTLKKIVNDIVMENLSLYIDCILHKGKRLDYRNLINIDISLNYRGRNVFFRKKKNIEKVTTNV